MAETYREIQVTETDSGAPVTAELMEALRANLIAVIEGASGAPRVQRQGIATDISSVSGDVSSISVNISLNSFSFFPSISSNSALRLTGGTGDASADDPKFRLSNTSGVSQSYEIAWRFIAAS